MFEPALQAPGRISRYFLTAVFVLLGCFGIAAHARAATFYFNNACSSDPTEQCNYWNDEGLTDPATVMPDDTVDTVIITEGSVYDGNFVLTWESGAVVGLFGTVTGDVAFKFNTYNSTIGIVQGDATFEGGDPDGKIDAAYNAGTVNGSATFNGNSTNQGTVDGNASFYDSAANNGTVVSDADFHGQANSSNAISGNASFYDQSSNYGLVSGNATFYEDLAGAGGTVEGTRTRIYSAVPPDTTPPVISTQDFTISSPWTVVADGVEVDLTSALLNNDTSLVTLNGGSFIGVRLVYDYFFNNAVNTDPTELGNYWLDSDATVPATLLPRPNIDPLTVLAGATYAGSVTFFASTSNYGTVTGTAIFNGGSRNESSGVVLGNVQFNGTSSNYGDLQGASISFTENAQNYRSLNVTAIAFSGSSINHATIASPTITFSGAINEGVLIGNPEFTYAQNSGQVYGNASFFTTAQNTASGSVSGEAIFYDTASVNAGSAGITKRYFQNTGSLVIFSNKDLTVHGPWIVVADGVTVVLNNVTYNNGTTFTTINNGRFMFSGSGNPFSASAGTLSMPGGLAATSYAQVLNNKVYATELQGSSLFVYNISSGEVESRFSIPQGTDIFMGHYANKLYIPNGLTKVSVFNTQTNTVTAVLNVGDGAKTVVTLGTKLYVTSQHANTVTVIDGLTDTVIKTVAVGSRPYYASTLGNKVYISNNTSSLSVINPVTDTVEAQVTLGSEPVLMAAVGTKLYISNKISNSISVFDTLTNTVVKTIAVGYGPEMSVLVGHKLYITNRNGNTVSVVDTDTDEFVKLIFVAREPYYLTASGNKVFIANTFDTVLSVIDTATDTISYNVTIPYGPIYPTANESQVFIPGTGFTVLDINEVDLPALTSFTSSTADGTYFAGDSINITANFNRSLHSGSTMTVRLNTGASVTLSTISGSALSGTYVIGAADTRVPDLQVSSIISASVTDNSGHNRTAYSLPLSVGTFTGENSAIIRNIGDYKAISIGGFESIATGSHPYQVSSPVTVEGVQYVYVANQGDGTVSAIRVSDHSLAATITIGSEPYGLSLATVSGVVYVYVANTNSNTVSVIDTRSNTVAATVSVGLKPYYVATIGTKVYVTNGQSNTVSVINAATNTVSSTIAVGNYPRGIKAYGTELYVANYGDPFYYFGGNSVSVIDSMTDTVTNTIVMPAYNRGARGVTTYNGKVYVTNYTDGSVSVIDPNTKTVTATIAVGAGPRGLVGLNGFLYVENFDSGTVSIIDTATNTVSSTLPVGHSPAGIAVVGEDLWVSNFQDDKILLVHSHTNTLHTNDAIPPAISGLAVTATTNSATVTWTTDEFSSTAVRYGLTEDYDAAVSAIESVQSHSITISNLNPGTTYHFQAISEDEDSNSSRSADARFVTAGQAGISASYIYGPATPPVVPKPLPPAIEPVPEPLPTPSKPARPLFAPFNRDLQFGNRSAEVKRLQQFLIVRGFLPKGNDIGIYGPLTRKAVAAFQRKYKIKPANGRFGPLTRAKANTLLKQ